MIRFALKRDIVDVPVKHARRLIEELERSATSPQMRASAAAKISRAISDLPLLQKVTLSLGEKVTLNKTLRDVANKAPSLPPALRELLATLTDELDRARSGEASREREARRAARLARARRRGFS